eukprot:3124911-Pyramimonas_sp.AAC.1
MVSWRTEEEEQGERHHHIGMHIMASTQSTIAVLPRFFRGCDLHYARDRVLGTSFVLVDPHDKVHARPGMGAFPGDHAAAKISIAADSAALDDAQRHEWQEE